MNEALQRFDLGDENEAIQGSVVASVEELRNHILKCVQIGLESEHDYNVWNRSHIQAICLGVKIVIAWHIKTSNLSFKN